MTCFPFFRFSPLSVRPFDSVGIIIVGHKNNVCDWQQVRVFFENNNIHHIVDRKQTKWQKERQQRQNNNILVRPIFSSRF
jgi:hypothetical protein